MLQHVALNPEICTGRGICIESCPMQAIELINGKAFINELNAQTVACVKANVRLEQSVKNIFLR